MRKPILAGALGSLAAAAVIAGLLAFQVWPFGDPDSPQVHPVVVSGTETSPDGNVASAPEDILDVELSVGNSITAEVTRSAVLGDSSETQTNDASPGTIVPPASTEAPPRGDS